jgi:Uma2 family endonuclease
VDGTEDHFVFLHGVGWSDYQRISAIRGDGSVPRMSFIDGELQLMRPSFEHERIKCAIRSLLSEWCLERDVTYSSLGSWTLQDEATACATEADDCYVFGRSRRAPRPDLAIEVIWTDAGFDKLEIYARLRVPEVWIWFAGTITPYVLRGSGYRESEQSATLPGIDLRQLASLLDRDPTSDAIHAYRALLRSPHPSTPTSST